MSEGGEAEGAWLAAKRSHGFRSFLPVTHIETAETTWLAQPSARCPEISVVIDAEGLGLLRRPPLECLQRIGSVLNRDYPGPQSATRMQLRQA